MGEKLPAERNVPGIGLARPNPAQKSSAHKFSATESTGSGNLFYALWSFRKQASGCLNPKLLKIAPTHRRTRR
jgi:hypothetical protein